jgi:predicted short-subunit dehydrogenase-like oxidoreductase (DUF2520 family)
MAMTLERIAVIGHGRVGAAVAERLQQCGLLADPAVADIRLLCVPDRAIADVARGLHTGPWIAHVSGATPLAALAPHVRRFGVHPLQTFSRSRGAEQMDGAWAAITGETDEARGVGRRLARALGLQPFDLDDGRRALYHAGASIASNFLVTIHRAAVRAMEAAGAPPEALVPLMTRTIENDFALTGPIARGDTVTIDAHLAALHEALPDLVPLYRALAAATQR